MGRKMGFNLKRGFTLIEVLVTVVVIGVLAAVVIPAVTSQVTAGDSSRVLSDMNNLRTGIENFDIAVRQFPGDIDDLVNAPGTVVSSSGGNSGLGNQVDADLTGALYTAASLWAGPYIEAVLPATITSSTLPNPTTTAYNTGYGGQVSNKFLSCQITNTTSACSPSSADYVVVLLTNFTEAQNNTLNTAIDGANEASSSTSGKFRTSSTSSYFFATPYK